MRLKSSLSRARWNGRPGAALGAGNAHAQAEQAPAPPQRPGAGARRQMPRTPRPRRSQRPPVPRCRRPARPRRPTRVRRSRTTRSPPAFRARRSRFKAAAIASAGPHPAPGGGWEATPNPHVHNYAPFDLRLFSYHNGCYYFIGDPRDFGYTGQSYSYYGAHPIADEYGGGWCFMVGPHYHWWRPWSPYFTTVGSWYYWQGPYDPFFWAYWPFYSFYYRSYYPSYYAGGRYYRGGFRPAPADRARPGLGRGRLARRRRLPRRRRRRRRGPRRSRGGRLSWRARLRRRPAVPGRLDGARRSPTPARAAAAARFHGGGGSFHGGGGFHMRGGGFRVTVADASARPCPRPGGGATPLRHESRSRRRTPSTQALSCCRAGRSCRRRRTACSGRSRSPGSRLIAKATTTSALKRRVSGRLPTASSTMK